MVLAWKQMTVRSFGMLGYIYSEAADWKRTQIAHAVTPDHMTTPNPGDPVGPADGRAAYMINPAANPNLGIPGDCLFLIMSGSSNRIISVSATDSAELVDALEWMEDWTGGQPILNPYRDLNSQPYRKVLLAIAEKLYQTTPAPPPPTVAEEAAPTKSDWAWANRIKIGDRVRYMLYDRKVFNIRRSRGDAQHLEFKLGGILDNRGWISWHMCYNVNDPSLVPALNADVTPTTTK
jgi:hypothetical protein